MREMELKAQWINHYAITAINSDLKLWTISMRINLYLSI